MANVVNIILRVVAGFLRFLQWVFAIVTIGFAGKLLYLHDYQNVGPHGRLIYTICWASVASFISFVWLVTFWWTWTWPHYVVDLIFSLGFFSAFGALTNWIHRIDCGRAFIAFGFFRQNQCNDYRMAEAGAFISASLWLFHAFMSCFLFHLHRRRIKSDRVGKKTKTRTAHKEVDTESI